MRCLDEELSSEDITDRIDRFLLKEMQGEELALFQEHIMECEFCGEQAFAGLQVQHILFAQGDIERSKELCQNGLYQLSIGNPQGASDFFRKSLEVFPDYFPAMMTLGKALNELGMHKEALIWLKKCESYDIDREALPMLWLDLSIAYYITNDIKNSLKYLEKAAPYFPDDIGITKNLGILYLRNGLLENAELCLEKVLTFQPDDYDMMANLSIVYLGREKINEAIKLLQTLEFVKGNDIDVLINLSYALFKIEKYESSENILWKAKSIEPEHLYVLTNLGAALCHNKKYQEALPVLKLAVSKYPEDAQSYNNLACVYYYLNSNELCLHYIKIARKLYPEDQLILNNYEVFTGSREGSAIPMFSYHDSTIVTPLDHKSFSLNSN